MRRWIPEARESLFRHALFHLERRRLAAGEERREAMVLEAPDWVNVIPLLDDGRVLLVRQWRYGIGAFTLEIPGGMVDPGEAERDAAARELLEETGYAASRWERLGETHPNPAFLTNRVSTWLATGLERVHPGDRPPGDGQEELSLDAVPLAEIPDLIGSGRITHALVVAGFYFLGLRRERS